MQGNLMTTLFALVFYLASGLFGGNSAQNTVTAPQTVPTGQQSIYPYAGTVSSQQATLRNAASSDSEIIDTVAEGASLLVLAEKNGWLQVQTETDKTGWIAKWMVKTKSLSVSSKLGNKIIAGYYVQNNQSDQTSYNSLTRNLGSINTVIPFSFKVDQYGTVSGTHNSKAVSLIRSAGGDALALVNNIQGGNFSSNTIHKMLSSSTARSRAVNNILRILTENGYQGVNIDFENIPASDRMYLTAFFRELSTALRAKGLLVTASVPAKTYDDKKTAHAGAYDYAALAPYIDQLMIMAYDEHYSGGSAGPVASYPWVEKVIKYALKSYSSQKIVLGIAGYGYDWTSSSGKARTYSAIQDLIKKYGVSPKWHSEYKVPYFTYKSWGVKHQVWYENSHSTAAKMSFVKKYNLRGVAVWRLGYEDQNIWKIILQNM